MGRAIDIAEEISILSLFQSRLMPDMMIYEWFVFL